MVATLQLLVFVFYLIGPFFKNIAELYHELARIISDFFAVGKTRAGFYI